MLKLRQAPQVNHDGVVPGPDRVQMLVVDGHAAADLAEDRRVAPVRARKQEHGGAGGCERADGLVELPGQLVWIAVPEDDVVAAGGNGYEVRLQGQRRRQLSIQDLP